MLSSKDRIYLDYARVQASFSRERNQHGCVIVKSGVVVGKGFNKFRNNPGNVSPEHIETECSYHAEVVALRQAGNNAANAVLYVARINGAGLDRDSRPCDNCRKAIHKARIKRVVYTTMGEYNVG